MSNITAVFESNHTHNLTYSASGANITATCSADGCPLDDGQGNHTATLNIGAPTTDDGKVALTASAEGAFDLDALRSAVKYSKTKEGGEWKDFGDTPFTENGFYCAKLTLGDVTASVVYGMNCITYATGLSNGSITGASGVTVGATVAPTITPVTGYELDTLTVNADNQQTVSVDGGTFVMPEANVIVSATFKLKEYTIGGTFTGGTVTAKKGGTTVTKANYQDEIAFTATPDEGYELSGSITVKDAGSQDVSLGANNTFTMPASDVTVAATFTANDYTVTVSETTNGTVQANKTTANVGDEITLTVNPATGYEIDTLTVTKASGGAVTVTDNKFTMPAEAVTVSATFAGRDMTATLNVTGDGGTASLLNNDYTTITNGIVTKKAGETFILRINKDEGYDFAVTLGSDSTAGITGFTKDEYQAYAAYAKENKISIPASTVLARVTMPGASDGSVTMTVTFNKEQTYTVLYQPTGSSDEVWCKCTTTVNSVEKEYALQMSQDSTMGGVAVWSVKIPAAFAPTKVAFAATKEAVEAVYSTAMTACSAKTSANDSDWTTIADSGSQH